MNKETKGQHIATPFICVDMLPRWSYNGTYTEYTNINFNIIRLILSLSRKTDVNVIYIDVYWVLNGGIRKSFFSTINEPNIWEVF